MKLSNFSIPVLRDAFTVAISRFPLALVSAFACGLISIYLIEYDDKAPELQRLFFSLAIGLPWLTGLHLIAERYLKLFLQKLLLFAFGVILLILLFIYIAPDFDDAHLQRPVRFFSFFLISHLLVSLSPFIRTGTIRQFWEYNKDLFVIWFVGAFYALIIYLGLIIALVAIDNLFDITIDVELYAHIFVLIAAFFHPVYVLSNFPKSDETEPLRISYSKAIRSLCIYILIPLSILYFIILYAYGFKILMSWELPRGWVSILVLGFSGIGLISYLLNYLIPDIELNKLSSLFKKYFFYILSPLVILLFVAINRRLSDYGFTPPRYFILITGVWLFLTCIYFVFFKTDNIKLIPMSLIAFLLLGTISPFDAFHITTTSQYNRLIHILEKNKAIENGKVISSLATLEDPEKESIKEMLYVLHDMGQLDKINTLLSVPIPLDTISFYDTREFLFQKLGLSNDVDLKTKFPIIYLSSPEKNDFSLLNFEWIFLFNLNAGGSDGNIRLIENQGMQLIVSKNIQDTIPLNDLVLKIDEKYINSGPDNLLEMPFDLSTKSYKHRLFIKQLNYQKQSSGFRIDYIQGVLLSGK